jgi:hypothetical protein
MEPWYNMNRIEQIIGRGVRNLSHCQLPFEERNVEIYLHATLPENSEEPADMYVYRFAEKKAFMIGRITRLLKETAIDCILNIGQTNFTMETLISNIANQKIILNLPSLIQTTTTGQLTQKQVEYQIGDRPYTDICDYMDNCNFTCSPNANITDTDIIKTTYNDDFVKMNYSSIAKRIRQLFKEQAFYTRDLLIQSINILKPYPSEQIDYTLTRFIENKNEYLTDALGRSGYLINTGDVYAFQPVEITDESASIYDRTAPIDHKPAAYSLELSPSEPSEDVEEDTGVIIDGDDEDDKGDDDVDKGKSIPVNQQIEMKYQTLLQDITENMKKAFDPDKTKIEGEHDWYRHVNNVIHKLTDYHKIPLEKISEYTIYHALDILPLKDRLFIVKYLYMNNTMPTEITQIEEIIQTYFISKVLNNRTNTKHAIFLANNDSGVWYLQNISNRLEWVIIDPEDTSVIREFSQSITEKKLNAKKKEDFNNIMGFMTYFKNDMVFKTKNLSQSRNNIGAYCEQATKGDILIRLNEVLGQFVYNSEFVKQTILKQIKTKDGFITTKEVDNGIFRTGLCVILEILLRYYNDTHYLDKIWFLSPEETIINQFVLL